MIVGYPLLSLFGLMIDARANCLRLGDGSTTIFKDPPPPPTVDKLSDSSGLSFFSVSVDRKAPQALAVAAHLGDPAGRELPSGPTTAGDPTAPLKFYANSKHCPLQHKQLFSTSNRSSTGAAAL